MAFQIPEEFIEGFAKAGQAYWSSLLSGSSEAGGIADGKNIAAAQQKYWQQQMALWGQALGQPAEPVAEAVRGDRRFHGEAWKSHPWYRSLQQQYLVHAQLLTSLAVAAPLPRKEKHKLEFFTAQLVNALSPANFAATNPDVARQAMDSNGESLRAGLSNLIEDLQHKRISITDRDAFEIGVNVAVSPGAVVFENDLLQLIQYAPSTKQVAARPLVIVPPCINKFYILDLQPENSFVRHAVENGLTVFLVSWRNPESAQGHLRWDDYVEQGALQALEVARTISGADQVNALGWCVGGTILSTALAVARARGEEPAASLTLLTTMLDFEEPGDLGVFIDEENVRQREQTIGQGGIYPGGELGFVFQAMRANDLIWPYVVDNYLKGKSPPAFDLLYWNADATNLPGPMYAWYLRNMYLENNLVVPDKLVVCETRVDLGRIDMPSYVLATQEDHIVPWRAAYRSTQLLGGRTQFVLGASGHIAGVINPASKNKRSYRSGGKLNGDCAQWLETSQETPGSWWSHWFEWLSPHTGKKVAAPHALGHKKYPTIEPAPGRYVKVKAS
ncbi:class I poly(R)-hydroxyalkanoic acid synthase [Ottowia thiooxydans]|uniref:class I poly(R)-hydroxyalkanoic acid synthase n=1 Tax=Ottowia thiooxydans TaxID=219182 RepID=UPI00041416F4|nr:class I poly(R)-hydroxyalkanoic acid synthase [Ottowia thiooxydans]